MGKLGFVFDFSENFSCIFFENKLNSTKRLIVFVEKENILGDYIVGFDSKLNLDNSFFVYLTKELSFEKFLNFERKKFMYSKISLSQKTIVDFENLTFWFSSRNYKILRDILHIDSSVDFENKLKIKIIDGLNYF